MVDYGACAFHSQSCNRDQPGHRQNQFAAHRIGVEFLPRCNWEKNRQDGGDEKQVLLGRHEKIVGERPGSLENHGLFRWIEVRGTNIRRRSRLRSCTPPRKKLLAASGPHSPDRR